MVSTVIGADSASSRANPAAPNRQDVLRRVPAWPSILVMTVHHLAFRTQMVERLVSFYVREIGFEVVQTSEHSPWLKRKTGAVLMIEQASEDEVGPLPDGLDFIAWQVDAAAYTRARARWEAAGELEACTVHTLYRRDPDGRRVGLSFHPLLEA